MSDSSDDEPSIAIPKSDFSLMPFAIVLCALCYIYGAWFGVYMCPK